MNTITHITIIGDQLCTEQSEIQSAARSTLDWHGYSESDTDPLELAVEGPFEDYMDEEELPNEAFRSMISVRTAWGKEVTGNRNRETELVAAFTSQKDAEDYVDRHNAAAQQEIIDGADPIELPFPVESVYFARCRPGNYPQSRQATIDCEWIDAAGNRREITAIGYGNAPFIRETHSAEALANAVEKLLEQLQDPQAGLKDDEQDA